MVGNRVNDEVIMVVPLDKWCEYHGWWPGSDGNGLPKFDVS